MDFRYLKAFLLTAKYLSFSKAANELKIAQSAVSRQIKLLEESIGHELIIRSSKKVLLTAQGKELFTSAQIFEKDIDHIFTSETIKTIRVGVLHGLLENWLTTIITEYKSHSPHNLQITIDSPNALKDGIAEGRFDVVFTTDNIQNELVSSLKLFNEKLVLISKKEVDLSKLHTQTWVVYGEQNHFFQYYKKRSESLVMVNSMTAIIQLVKNNMGIAIVPDHMLRPGDKLQTYDLKALTQATSTIYMAMLNYKVMPPHLKSFIEMIPKEMK